MSPSDPSSSSKSATKALSAEKIILSGICALILTLGIARFAYTPLLPIMQIQAGLTYVSGGLLAAVNYGGYMTGVVLAMLITRPRSRFYAYRIGLILGVLSTIGMALSTDVFVWGIMRYLAGLASAAGVLLSSGLILHHLIRLGKRPQLGLHFSGLGLGTVVSGLTVILTVPSLIWSGQWVVLGIVGLLFLFPAWFWLPAPVAEPTSTKPVASNKRKIMEPWTLWMILAYFCGGFGFVVGVTFIVAFLVELPQLTGQGGWVWVVVGIAAAPSTFLWDRVALRTDNYIALMLAYALQGVAMILPAISDGVLVNMIAAALFGATYVGVVSLTLTIVGQRYPDNPSPAMARITFGYGIAQIFAPAMTGYLAELTNSYSSSFVISGLVMLLGVGLLWKAMRCSETGNVTAV